MQTTREVTDATGSRGSGSSDGATRPDRRGREPSGSPTADTLPADTLPAGWDIRRLAGELGAELRGLALAELTDAEFASLRACLLEHLVLFFPEQDLDIDAHVALGRRFGPIEGHPHIANPFTQHPELFELAASKGGVADEWHTDLTFRTDPALLSILQVKECPSTGGDTLWTSLYAAYEALSPPLRELCDGLSALHDATPHDQPDRMAIHPVVRIHPETGRKGLYVNEHFTRRIVELSAHESDHLLDYLTRWVSEPRFTVRYHWSPGTVAIWDNRCTQHFVLNDFVGERIIHRVTVMGDAPEGATPRWPPCLPEGRRSAINHHDRQLYRYLRDQRAGAKAEA